MSQIAKGGSSLRGVKSPLKWHSHGGKSYLADWVISHMPEHTRYVEPFFGGGSVLLRKNPEGISEFANDLNGDLASFWKILRDPKRFQELQRFAEATPLSQDEFETALENLDWFRMGEVEHAAAFFIRCRQSRQGLMKDYCTPTRRTRRGMNENVSAWLSAVDGLPDVHQRLRRVEVWNRPAIEVIDKLDSPDTLFYLDPPYLHETRNAKDAYEHEMTNAGHQELLEKLETIEGKFILSGYPSQLYHDFLMGNPWHMVTREIDNKSSGAKAKQKKMECLWMNFEPGEES